MPEPDRIAMIERLANHTVTAAAAEIKKLGGERALSDYVHSALSSLLGVVISEQGQDCAIELCAHGFQIAEAYVPSPEDTRH